MVLSVSSVWLVLIHILCFVDSGGHMTTPSGSFTNLSSNHGGGGGIGGGMNMGNMSNSGAMTPQQVQQAAQSLITSEIGRAHV